jgi:hypothetical protein
MDRQHAGRGQCWTVRPFRPFSAFLALNGLPQDSPYPMHAYAGVQRGCSRSTGNTEGTNDDVQTATPPPAKSRRGSSGSRSPRAPKRQRKVRRAQTGHPRARVPARPEPGAQQQPLGRASGRSGVPSAPTPSPCSPTPDWLAAYEPTQLLGALPSCISDLFAGMDAPPPAAPSRLVPLSADSGRRREARPWRDHALCALLCSTPAHQLHRASAKQQQRTGSDLLPHAGRCICCIRLGCLFECIHALLGIASASSALCRVDLY